MLRNMKYSIWVCLSLSTVQQFTLENTAFPPYAKHPVKHMGHCSWNNQAVRGPLALERDRHIEKDVRRWFCFLRVHV